MTQFARIDEQGLVTHIIAVGDQESQTSVKLFYENLLGGELIETSDDGSIRKQYASIGGRYDWANDVFLNQATEE
jgi:hypothetical protein